MDNKNIVTATAQQHAEAAYFLAIMAKTAIDDISREIADYRLVVLSEIAPLIISHCWAATGIEGEFPGLGGDKQ